MPAAHQFTLCPIDQIWVNREKRQRKEITTDDLRESIARVGLLQPVVINRDFELKAGERRWTTCKELGWTTIPAVFVDQLDEIEGRLIELEENVRRKDFTWQELVAGVAEIHQLYLSRDTDWSQSQTAEAMGLAKGTVSMYLRVQADMADQRVAASGSIREAFNLLQRRDQRAYGDALQELVQATTEMAEPQVTSELVEKAGLATKPPSVQVSSHPVPVASIQSVSAAWDIQSIFNQSFLEWAPTYEGPKFNLVHCDFPYGVNLFSSNGIRTGANRSQMGRDTNQAYADAPDVYWQLLDCLCDNFERFASLSCHLMFWFSPREDIYRKTIERFRQRVPSLTFTRFPLIWLKSCNSGIAADVRREPRHIYESCLLAYRGDRNILTPIGDAYSAPTDNKLHPSAKPEPMLRHFMRMLVDETTTLFDPTCGAGSALRAAESLGAKATFGLELSAETTTVAQNALREARMMRQAAKGL